MLHLAYGSLRSRHLEDLTALVSELARQTKDAPRTFKKFAATIMEKHYVSPTEIKEKVGELAKQGLIEPTWKTRKEKAPVPDVGDLVVWLADENTYLFCYHGFDFGSITPCATGVEVFRATSKKQRNAKCLQAIHQIGAVMRSRE
jgi:hypothetical protein